MAEKANHHVVPQFHLRSFAIGVGRKARIADFEKETGRSFVAIAHATPRSAIGGGAVVNEDGDTPGRVYQFRQAWIRDKLKASPSQLRMMHVEDDSMAPTLLSGDAVLVDMARRAPNPARDLRAGRRHGSGGQAARAHPEQRPASGARHL